MSARVSVRRAGGFSLVELMVSLVIGLLALTFATRLVLVGEQNKEASLGGSDAMQNGMLALFSITSDANQAGFGLNDDMLVGCDTRFNDTNGFQLATATRAGATITPLSPAVIESTAGSDTVTLYSGTSQTGTGTLGISSYPGGTTINVAAAPYGFAKDDVIVAAMDDPLDSRRCALSQITTAPVLQVAPAQNFLQIGGAGRFAGALGLPFGNYLSRVFNLGPAADLSFHTWSVVDGFLRLRATNLTGASAASQAVIDNVVALKAQYGFDTRKGALFRRDLGMQIHQWSATMIDADGQGGAGNGGDYQHIAALRVAVVARSKTPQKPNASGVCDATTVLPRVFDASVPTGVAAVPVDVTVAVTGDPVDWKCYKYRVFETVVPLRNAGWRPN
ncbi:MAG: PilW family protein [Pseudomonadota bacterium]